MSHCFLSFALELYISMCSSVCTNSTCSLLVVFLRCLLCILNSVNLLSSCVSSKFQLIVSNRFFAVPLFRYSSMLTRWYYQHLSAELHLSCNKPSFLFLFFFICDKILACHVGQTLHNRLRFFISNDFFFNCLGPHSVSEKYFFC